MRTVAIIGSRRWSDFDAFCEALPDLAEYGRIVSGGAAGVDTMACMIAGVLKIPCVEFRPRVSAGANHAQFTKAAHERNQRIVDAADAMIAFPGPRSRGTWDAIRRARKKGIPVIELKAPK